MMYLDVVLFVEDAKFVITIYEHNANFIPLLYSQFISFSCFYHFPLNLAYLLLHLFNLCLKLLSNNLITLLIR